MFSTDECISWAGNETVHHAGRINKIFLMIIIIPLKPDEIFCLLHHDGCKRVRESLFLHMMLVISCNLCSIPNGDTRPVTNTALSTKHSKPCELMKKSHRAPASPGAQGTGMVGCPNDAKKRILKND